MAIKVSILFIFLLLFSGCTFPVNFYMRNMTAEKIVIKARLLDKAASEVTYTDDIVLVSYDLHEEFVDTLRPHNIKGEYLYYSLPGHSTFYVGQGANFRNFTFDKIEVIYEDREPVVLDWENQQLLSKEKSFPNKHFAWYDIE